MHFKQKLVKTVAKANENLKKAQKYTDLVAKMVTGPKNMHSYVDHAIRLATTGADQFLEKAGGKDELVDVCLMDDKCKGDLTRIVTAGRSSVASDGLAPTNYKRFELYGQSIYTNQNGGAMYHHKNEDHHKVKAAIARSVWENSKGFVVISGRPYQAMFVDNQAVPPQLPSERATVIGARVETYLAKGKNRSILLYGSPGTGKSSIAASICGKLFKRTLMISINYEIGGEVLSRAVKEFDPEAIILNEVDKGPASGSLLEALDLMNQRLKLVVGTANITKFMNKALIRPGRFDEIVSIEGIDHKTLAGIVNFPCSEELKTELQQWPIAFLNELRNRVEVEPDGFVSHLDDLRERLKLNEEESNKKKSRNSTAQEDDD